MSTDSADVRIRLSAYGYRDFEERAVKDLKEKSSMSTTNPNKPGRHSSFLSSLLKEK
jgi:hypothetical protein